MRPTKIVKFAVFDDGSKKLWEDICSLYPWTTPAEVFDLLLKCYIKVGDMYELSATVRQVDGAE